MRRGVLLMEENVDALARDRNRRGEISMITDDDDVIVSGKPLS